jgi:hypothetical protein
MDEYARERVMKRSVLLLALSVAGLAAPSIAQQPAMPQQPQMSPANEMRAACASDLQTLCASAASAQDKHRCLMANIQTVSPGCQSALQAVKAVGRDVKHACAADFSQFCAGAQGPARMQCLRQNQDKISTGCQSALAEMHPPRQ